MHSAEDASEHRQDGVVVCGKNAAVKKELEESKLAEIVNRANLDVFDSNERMAAIAASDQGRARYDRRGGDAGLPCLLSSHLPRARGGNVKDRNVAQVDGKEAREDGATIAQGSRSESAGNAVVEGDGRQLKAVGPNRRKRIAVSPSRGKAPRG